VFGGGEMKIKERKKEESWQQKRYLGGGFLVYFIFVPSWML